MGLQDMSLTDVAVLGLKLGVVLAVSWVLLWGMLHLFMWMAVAVQMLSALGERLLMWLAKMTGQVRRRDASRTGVDVSVTGAKDDCEGGCGDED